MKNSETIPMTNSGHRNKENSLLRLYNSLLAEFGRMKLGYETLALLAQSCLGGIAAMLVLKNDTFPALKITELFFVTLLAMGFNAAVLVNLKSKLAFNILITSVLFSILMIVVNL